MPGVFEYLHIVRGDEIDELGHAHNLAYIQWMLEAALAHSAAQGWPAEAYLHLGAGWVVRSHKITYLSPAFEGDEVLIRTWVADFRRATSLRRYEMLRRLDGARLARAATHWAFIDFATRALRRVPPEVAQAYEVCAGPGDASAPH
jgi:acyl-CoA thioester hydrolase